MKEFFYKAKKSPQEIITGTIKADDKNAALNKLSEEGLFPIELKEKHISKGLFKELFVPKKISSSKMSSFTRSVSDLLDGGIPVLEVFQIMARQTTHPVLKDSIDKIRKDLRDGQALSWSMQNQGQRFSPLFINLVKAGEVSGTLESSFSRIADFYERKNILRNSLLKSMSYPVFLLLVGSLTLAILFIFILPKLIPVFTEMEVPIPLVTRILLSVSDIVKNIWKILIVAAGISFFVIRRFLSSIEGRVFFQRFLFKLPYIKQIILKKELSESFYSLGTLIQNGVPPVKALEITAQSTGNILLAKEWQRILHEFQKGKSISELLEKSAFFFPEAVNMVRVGEKTGNLEKPLLKLSQHYERDVSRTLEIFITIIEPLMILLFGATIGFIAIAILLPIFQMNLAIS